VNSANAAATVTAITSSNLAPTYGQSVTLTATVTPAPSGTAPGTISFYAGTTLLGAQALNAHGVATLSVSLPLGPNAITAVYSGSAGFAASTSSALSVSARALSAITFSASPTTQLATMAVVFTAQVNSATAGVQTGIVSFLNGSTVLATVTIVAGQPAVYSETALSSGAYSVTASYSGDGNFLPSASTGAPISITVSDLDLALGSDNNKSVVPGGAVTYNFPLSPVVTSTFIYNVTLTATGLPPGATYTFSPATIPAGSGALPVAFTVQTARSTAMLHRAQRSSRSPWFALVFGLLLPLAGAKRFRAQLTKLPRVLLLLVFGGLSLGLVAGLGGCGSGGFLGSPKGQTSYTITISATSGALVRTSTVQLNLE
jgi:Bacterial Ig-like domain (group 3)